MKIGNIKDVSVPVEVVLGSTNLRLEDFANIGEGTILELDKLCGEPVDLVVSGQIIARGEVVVIDENFGIRVTELITKEK